MLGPRERARVARHLLVTFALVSGASFAQAPTNDPWLSPDKALHFSVSAVLAGFTYGTTAIFTESRGVRVGVATGVALTAGIAKELFDLAGLGQPSWKDLAWDALGTAVGVVVSWLLDVFVITPLSRPAPASAPMGP